MSTQQIIISPDSYISNHLASIAKTHTRVQSFGAACLFCLPYADLSAKPTIKTAANKDENIIFKMNTTNMNTPLSFTLLKWQSQSKML